MAIVILFDISKLIKRKKSPLPRHIQIRTTVQIWINDEEGGLLLFHAHARTQRDRLTYTKQKSRKKKAPCPFSSPLKKRWGKNTRGLFFRLFFGVGLSVHVCSLSFYLYLFLSLSRSISLFLSLSLPPHSRVFVFRTQIKLNTQYTHY